MIKLVATDIDGTLLQSGENLGKMVPEAVLCSESTESFEKIAFLGS